MNVIIVEDEASVAQNLSDLLLEMNPEIKILVVLETVKNAIQWFQKNEAPDIAFFDIKIADGSSFEILEKITLSFPIIFTTAFDEYALKAFKYNSIDYLLKPIKKADLEKAIVKYQSLYTRDKIILDNNSKLLEVIKKMKQTTQKNIYKSSFLVNYRNQLIPINTNDIAYFYLEHQIVYCRTYENSTYQVSSTLEKLQTQLNPATFFRVNRQFIIAKQAVTSAIVHEKRKLKLNVSPESSSEVIISKLKANSFKKWMNS